MLTDLELTICWSGEVAEIGDMSSLSWALKIRRRTREPPVEAKTSEVWSIRHGTVVCIRESRLQPHKGASPAPGQAWGRRRRLS